MSCRRLNTDPCFATSGMRALEDLHRRLRPTHGTGQEEAAGDAGGALCRGHLEGREGLCHVCNEQLIIGRQAAAHPFRAELLCLPWNMFSSWVTISPGPHARRGHRKEVGNGRTGRRRGESRGEHEAYGRGE